jgi:hypothetical protein
MEFKIVEIKGQILIKEEIITKMQKSGGIIEKSSSQEPVSQNKSDFQESFLIKCKFKLFKS